MKKLFFLAAVATMTLASCMNDEFVGAENSPTVANTETDAILFGFGMKNATRGDIFGGDAAAKLGNHFYVMGTKGSEDTDNPSEDLVFDNYLVHYAANTAGTTESNTANWEYVGVQPAASGYTNYAYLTSMSPARTAAPQTIKYWDYSNGQYDFFAFSTGTKKAVTGKTTLTISDDEINVTKMNYGRALESNGTAYTFIIPTISALENAYITDITPVLKTSYGKEVNLRFKNLGSKIRLALYETVPGYAVKDVNFYQIDGTTDFSGAKSTTAALITADATYGFPTKGTIDVYFPNVGTESVGNDNRNKAAATVTPVAATTPTEYHGFGNLHNFALTKEGLEATGNYLGRTLPDATFAGDKDAAYYQTVFPISNSSPLTLRVDYTLVSTDGSGEEINVYGAKAVVPSTYTKWQPNYAYTYIFKISDNTNGWTDNDHTKAGLFPITFDAVVAEATEVSGEQKTITTVAAPSITTYQQNHDIKQDEYDKKTGKNVYVQVMKDGSLVNNLNHQTDSKDDFSFLYLLDDDDATEAKVVDALEKRTAAIGDPQSDVKGRNNLSLTNKYANLDNTVDEIINGVDDNPIDLTDGAGVGGGYGKAAMLNMTALAVGTYAYVYFDGYSEGAKKEVHEYQPINPTAGSSIDGTPKTYYLIDKATVEGTTATTSEETVNNDYLYFSKTYTKVSDSPLKYEYKCSYISVSDKTTVPAGVVKILKSSLSSKAGNVALTPDDVKDNFFFDHYYSNNGLYAVKVIKIVDTTP